MDALTVYESPLPKVRLGKVNDGGYVIIDLPPSNFEYDYIIAGGISNDISFEDALCSKFSNIHCIAFDGTIDNIPEPINKNRIKFIKKNLGDINTNDLTDLMEYIEPYNNIFMKIDIEGHEFNLIPAIIKNNQICKVKQLVLEVHTPADMRLHPNYYKGLEKFNRDEYLFQLLRDISRTHTLVHLHANNGCKQHTIDSTLIPNVFETTFIRNDILEDINYKKTVNTIPLPMEIDMKNILHLPDIILDYPPFCHKPLEKSISSVSLVSCYYRINSKHSHEQYQQWIINLLTNINANIIIFTSQEQSQWLEQISRQNRNPNGNPNGNPNDNPNVKIIVKELEDLEPVRKYGHIWDEQVKKDPTPEIRTKECYMIWNSKMALVNEAIRINPFGSDKFIWNDIGSMRDFNYSSKLASYPRYENISPDKLDIVLIEGFHNPNQLYFQHEVHLSGSIFGASREVFLQIVELFYKYFDLYLERGLFIGCDQQMLATCYKLHPELFNLVIPANDNTIDKWFYLYHHYTKTN